MIVLIVEDEPIIAISLALVLESAGHTIIGPVRPPRPSRATTVGEKTEPR